MPVEIVSDIVSSGLAPFTNQVGWQGFAYGLLGLKAIKRTINITRDIYEDNNASKQ